MSSEDAPAPADEEGGHAERAAEVLGGGLKRLRQVRRPRCAVPVGLSRPYQMIAFLHAEQRSFSAWQARS